MGSVETLMTTAVVLLNLGLAVLVGAVLTDWQLQRQESGWSMRKFLPLRRLRVLSSLWLGVMLVAIIALETSTMAEVPLAEIGPSIAPILTDTHFGHVWLWSMGSVAVLFATQIVRRISTPTLLACAMGIVSFAVSRSLVSHAVSAGNLSWPVVIETVHLLLISVWIGEVFLSGLHVLRTACGRLSEDRNAYSHYVNALSTTATVALVGIVITGLFNAWRGLGSVNHLLDNPWSWILITKLGMVVSAAGLGAFNRWAVMPNFLAGLDKGIDTDKLQKRFARVLQIEAVVLIGVLIAAALLSSSSPPTAM